MSLETVQDLPMSNSPARAQSKESIWRLLALGLAHPLPEFHSALVEGRFQEAFNSAWQCVTGRHWRPPTAPSSQTEFEAGYIHTFLHGHNGFPVASLMAGEYEQILSGLSRPVFMLNLSAFYRHFGLKVATADEGRQDEPDHLVTMAEFMAVLCMLEGRALVSGRDTSPYRRAQRDFLCRFLSPLLDRVEDQLRRNDDGKLDHCLRLMLKDVGDWAQQQISELAARVGPFRDLDAPKPQVGPGPTQERAPQNLWG